MNNSTSIAHAVEYLDLFPERDIPNIQKLLKGLDRDKILKVIDNLYKKLANKLFYNPKWTDNQDDTDVLRFFLSKQNIEYTEELIEKYKVLPTIPKYHDNTFIGATLESGVYILREIMSMDKDNYSLKSQKDLEKDMLNALLVANYITMNKGHNYPKNPKSYELRMAFAFIGQFHNDDIIQQKYKYNIFLQSIKCERFFEFAKKDKYFSEVLILFKTKYGISKWNDYPRAFWTICTMTNFQTGRINFNNAKDKNGLIIDRILALSSIDINAQIPLKYNIDYSAFREKPFIHTLDHEYFITNIGFVIEKLYNSLYFEFKGLWEDLYKVNLKEKNSFNQHYTKDFTEDFLFDNCMNEIFKNGEYDVLTSPF